MLEIPQKAFVLKIQNHMEPFKLLRIEALRIKAEYFKTVITNI